jgi:anti-sigma factor ChrR (cupin superfamily)
MMHTATDEEASGRAALYALGALGAEEARAFEEHLEAGCAACAAEAAEFAAAVEALAYAAPPAEPPPSVRERLLARVAGVEQVEEETRGASSAPASGGEVKDSAGATPGAGFFILRAAEGEWRPTDDAGVSFKLLYADRERGTLTTLVRMEPGARIPAHRHLGVEQCLVLEGDVRSGPHRMGAGDFNCSLPDSVHQELTSDGGALLLFVAPAAYEPLGA